MNYTLETAKNPFVVVAAPSVFYIADPESMGPRSFRWMVLYGAISAAMGLHILGQLLNLVVFLIAAACKELKAECAQRRSQGQHPLGCVAVTA